jgi:hypothetical protein
MSESIFRELGRRAKTLHRRAFVDSPYGYQSSTHGPVSVQKHGDEWVIYFESYIVFKETKRPDLDSAKSHIVGIRQARRDALLALRQIMVLDDMAKL